MANFLVLTSDLPFFPGKNGHDFFNLAHLARTHTVAVVAPCYDSYPPTGVANLETAIDAVYAWPRPAPGQTLLRPAEADGQLRFWAQVLPAPLRRWLARRMLGLAPYTRDSLQKLAILANCAPHFLEALHTKHWHGVVIIQSSMQPWLAFLPRFGGKCVYFHDVRSDYLKRARPPAPPKLVCAVHQQEVEVCLLADAAGFVSNLDLDRARETLPIPEVAQVASIPVDTNYFTPRPRDRPKHTGKRVLFTGHLSHPPNVDAVLYFLSEIWPTVLQAAPDALFVVAGLCPAPAITTAVAAASRAELHPNVPDIRPYFWDTDVYVVPMRFGGGVRQKIFEAWCMEIPVVCTTMGAEGTQGENGRHCWLEDDAKAFAARIVALLGGFAPVDMLAHAKKLVLARHAIPVAGEQFARLCEATVGARRRRPYRLLFDLRWMKIGRAGGTEQMTHELLHALASHDRVHQFRAFVPRQTYYEWDLDPGFDLKPFFSDKQEDQLDALHGTVANRFAESVGMPPILNAEMRTLRALHQMDFDLVHALCGYIHPSLAAFPHILTVHDLQHLAYPGFFGTAEWEERDRLYRDSINRAVHIIAISDFTRQDIHRHYNVPLEKISTIWNIPSRHAWQPIAESTRLRLLQAMGLDSPFIFFPGHCWPHKNHVRLIEAFKLLRPQIPRDIKLVLTGRPFPAEHPARSLIAGLGLEDRVLHLGYRSPLEMKALFRSCLVLAFPSLFEGFGMPVAEAIIAGRPVACSRTTSLPEIAGDAALTFDPENAHEIADRLLQCVTDPACQQRLQEAAMQRRNLFRARTAALQTLSLYQRVFDSVYSA